MITHKIFKSEEEMNKFVSLEKYTSDGMKVISIETVDVTETGQLESGGFVATAYKGIKLWYQK